MSSAAAVNDRILPTSADKKGEGFSALPRHALAPPRLEATVMKRA
jgi:hypothetical protein